MFNYIDKQKQVAKLCRENEALNARQSSVEVATSIAFVTLAENGNIDEMTAIEHTELFLPWAVGVAYPVGVLRQYNDILYRCVQAHTSQEDWAPDVAFSLWVKVGDPADEYPNWSQPIGSHDTYMFGDKVSYNGQHWISVTDNNVWQPGVYGWEVTE